METKKPLAKNVSSTVAAGFDFSKLKEVPPDSIEAKLFNLIDDIDTATDIYRPKMEAFEDYVVCKIHDAHKLIVSDGYKLYYTGKEKP